MNRIAIRRENKNHWEKRVPLVPDDIVDLVADEVPIAVQPSSVRAFADESYATAGATIRENIDRADLILGVKEVPASYFKRPAAWMFFSHTIKGQPQNMAALRALMDSGSTLFDYELIVNEEGQRLVFFGRHAGYAGAIESLVALSKRWQANGHRTLFSKLRQPYEYTDLAEALADLKEIGEEIQKNGLPEKIPPLRIVIMGAGNVSEGVQHVLNALPMKWHEPEEYLSLENPSRNLVHATILREHDMVEPRDEGHNFDLQDFYDHPEKYQPRTARFLAKSTLAITAYYWDKRYPRYIANAELKSLAEKNELPLQVIGDITCDIHGSVEPTIRPTDPGDPVYTFDPVTGTHKDGIQPEGISIMAVDNLPCELSVDASRYFSTALAPFIPALAKTDFDSPDITRSALPEILQRACIVWRGELTESFEELSGPLDEFGGSE